MKSYLDRTLLWLYLSKPRFLHLRRSGFALILIIAILLLFTAPTWAFFSDPAQANMLLSFGTWPTPSPTPTTPPCGRFTFTLTARGYWEIVNGCPRYGARGEICITNTGTAPLENPLLRHLVYASQEDDLPVEYSNFLVDLSAHPILQPAETYCYAYDHSFTPTVGMRYLASISLSFDNTCPLIPVTARGGPAVMSALRDEPRDDPLMVPFSMPDEPEIINDATPTPQPLGTRLDGKQEVVYEADLNPNIRTRACFTNSGEENADNLRSFSWLEWRAGSGEYLPVDGTRMEHPLLAELFPGGELCLEREFHLELDRDTEYRFITHADIDNLTGWLPGSDSCPGDSVCPQGITLQTDFTTHAAATPTATQVFTPTITPTPTSPEQATPTLLPSSTPLPTEAPPTAVPTPVLPESPTPSFTPPPEQPTPTDTAQPTENLPASPPGQDPPTPVATPVTG